jgi:glutaredoxin-dependent peroxiredoxin
MGRNGHFYGLRQSGFRVQGNSDQSKISPIIGAMALPVGTLAPDFSLRTMTADGPGDFRLSDHVGKSNVVLLFFPGAFTHVCQAEMCQMSNEHAKYEALNAVVCGISIDTIFALNAWAKAENIGIPLLSDLHLKVTEAYDVVFPDFVGMGPAAARAAFVVDKEGKIAYAEVTPTLLDLPDFAAIESVLTTLN